MSSNWGIMPQKQPKTFVMQKGEYEGAVDQHKPDCTRWFQKFHSGCKTVGLKLDSKDVLETIETNSTSTTKRVSGEFGILQSSVVHHLNYLGKKHLELLNRASHYQNITKFLTHPSICEKSKSRRSILVFCYCCFFKCTLESNLF